MEDILSKYNTSIQGLSEDEALKRQKEYGLNKLDEKKQTPLIILFLSQFIDILIALLLIAAIASIAIGDYIDAGVIILAVLLNTILGFIQEYRSRKAVDSLESLMVKKAVVKRENEIIEVEAEKLTIGDIVVLEEGNVFMDSNIISGHGLGVVENIGMKTEIGKIAKIVQEEDEETPLEVRVGRLGKILSAIAIVVCIIIFILELLQGVGLVETFMTAVSLAVAAIPEGLPAVLTLTLALGMSEMASSNAIVKRLLSVETLGSCTIICSDKTGTLTENRMSVVDSYLTNEDKTLLISKLCNNATIKNDKTIGNQTDGAILKFAKDYDTSLERVDEIPLDSNRKMMTTIHRLDDENNIVLSKGAPEIILDKCKYIDDNGSIEIIEAESKEKILKKINEMSEKSLRVIGFAYKINDEGAPEENLIFTGLLGLIDPPKENAKQAVTDCINAGIAVKMITGDHEKTARAIAKHLGILTTGQVITGAELERLTDDEYLAIADDIQVYARVKPAQKMRIENIEKLGKHSCNDW